MDYLNLAGSYFQHIFSPSGNSATQTALKKLAAMTEEVKSKEEEVFASLSSLRALVADDQERLLAR